ncbi:BRO-N domain-containing protein [Arsenophonus nasoniae]|uniref:BRO family protein n=1 Tax=Arsenophonus nasoniae TaxID=638 RepID=A0AA95GU90_9GAMM|nr:BRO family protein [Arsenophonus nasoniae]WGM00062.1 BRO family protein [Arsenophonus nasoniae]
MNTLIFRNTILETISRNGQIWFTSSVLSKALEYSRIDSVTRIYDRNKDEFTPGMSMTVNLTFNGINNSLREKTVRIFSLRGAHLIAMFANTPVAKEFRKWVLDILDKQTVNQTSNFTSKYQPKAAERFSHSDTRNLTHLVWCMTNGFRFERSWSNAVWLALREVTGTPSPERFQVEHIPLMADECRRIYYITESLRQIINDAEKQVIKRLLRKRENIDTVLAEIKQLFEQFHHQQIRLITARTDHWYEGELTHFLERH